MSLINFPSRHNSLQFNHSMSLFDLELKCPSPKCLIELLKVNTFEYFNK